MKSDSQVFALGIYVKGLSSRSTLLRSSDLFNWRFDRPCSIAENLTFDSDMS